MSSKKLITSIAIATAMLFGIAAAQTTTTSNTSAADLSTTVEVAAEDLGVKDPTFWEFFKRRFVRTFTFNSVKKAKLDLELANLTLLKARQATTLGNDALASQLIDQYNKQITSIDQQIDTITAKLPVDNPRVQSLLDQIAQNNVLVASALDRMTLKATGEFNKKLTKAKLEAIKDVAKVLAKENLSPEKLAEKLEKIAEKLAEKETKAEKKLAKRLAAIEEINDQEDLDDKDLDEALEKARDREVEKIANDKGIGDVVREIEGSIGKHILVLQEVLKKAPDSAKPAIQAAIDRAIEKLKEKAQKDVEEINKAIDAEDEDRVKIKKEVIKKLKEKFKDEKLKEELEKKEEQIEKVEEELEKESSSQDTSSSSSGATSSSTGTATTTGTSGTSGGSSSSGTSGSSGSSSGTSATTGTSGSSTTEAKRYDVKFKDGKFDTSDLPGEGIKVGDSIRFKNDDDESVQIQSNPHPTHTGLTALNIGVLKKGEEKVVKFEKAGTYGWHNHLNTSVTGSVTVK